MKILGQTSAGKVFPVQVDDDGQLQIDLKAIAAGSNLIGRVDARDGDKIWSFNEILEQSLYDGNIAAGTVIMSGRSVPSGEIWNIKAVNVKCITTTINQIEIFISGLASGLFLADLTTITSNKWYFETFDVFAQEGDMVSTRVFNATAGDSLNLRYCGYKMQV